MVHANVPREKEDDQQPKEIPHEARTRKDDDGVHFVAEGKKVKNGKQYILCSDVKFFQFSYDM